MRDLDTPEIHGYLPDFGYRVYTEKAIEMSALSRATVQRPPGRGVYASAATQKASKKKPTKRGGNGRDRRVPEVGQMNSLASSNRRPGASRHGRLAPTSADRG